MASDVPAVQRVTFTADGRPVTIMPKRAPVGNSAPIRGRTVTIIPDAPGNSIPLDTRIRSALPVAPRALLTGVAEPGALPAAGVMDLDESEAAALGQALGLVRVLFWDGRRASLLECGPAPTSAANQ